MEPCGLQAMNASANVASGISEVSLWLVLHCSKAVSSSSIEAKQPNVPVDTLRHELVGAKFQRFSLVSTLPIGPLE